MGINVIYSMMKYCEYIYIYEDNHEYHEAVRCVVLFKNNKTYKCSKNKINGTKTPRY